MDRLVVVGARQHNLRNVSLSLPRGKVIVFTGPSGSGKSSLAFDTIYAEGQRRYVESLSAYARQFLEQLAKPDVERIDGLSPAIAIEQRPLSKSPRSTVGTVTEIADYLRLLYARVGIPHCPTCGKRIEAQTVQQIVDWVLAMPEGTKLSLMSPIARARKGELKLELERLRREGFVRARIDGSVVDLGDEIELDRTKIHDLDVVVDWLALKDGIKGRLTDSVELALKLGEGRLLVQTGDEEPFWMSERFACVDCGISLPPIEPRMFSFNGPHGACPTCDGLGARDVVDPERCTGDPRHTLREGVVLAWGRRGSVALSSELASAVETLGVNPDVPWAKLPEEQRKAILFGADAGTTRARERARKKGSTRKRDSGKKQPYSGIVPRLEQRLASLADLRVESAEDEDPDASEGGIGDDELGRFLVTRTCDACKGKRLRPEALAVKLGGKDVAQVGALPLRHVRKFVESLGSRETDVGEALASPPQSFGPRERAIAEPLLKAVAARLGFLIDVGLDYLALDRSAQTLSSGEGQRIRLATQIGAALVGVLYVLDEPSVGLHARDNARLIEAQARLRDLGNTVIVVEHDREAILAADHVVDMGPGAGVHGGEIIAQGTPREIMANAKSITGPWLSGRRQLPVPTKRRPRTKTSVRVVGARAHNLQNVTSEIPLGVFTCITGVSGSGKSSLIVDTLLPAARAKLYNATAPVGECDRVEGLDQVDKVVSIDQAPIGRTPRSNPATYTGIFALLRDLYAGLPDARARGYKAGRFSFNVKGGRCEACQGDGVLRVEMHFLPDVFVACDACGGLRYNRETLEVKYRGLSIADALAVTVEQASDLVRRRPEDRRQARGPAEGRPRLRHARPAGDDPLRRRGAAREARTRALAARHRPHALRARRADDRLHFADIEVLLTALMDLRDQGNTIIVIEHNLDVVACADWVIDLGPEGGEGGGEIVAAGTPEDILSCDRSHTARYLRDVLARATPAARRAARG